MRYFKRPNRLFEQHNEVLCWVASHLSQANLPSNSLSFRP